jgi:predicted acyltransferase
MKTERPIHPGRLPSIDAFRGLAVLMMAAVNYIGGVGWMPAILKHAPDVGYTVADVIAPMFIMAIGFTAGMSFRGRRERMGTASALGGMAARYLAILGIGAIISAGQALCMPGGERLQNWGVLQAIGGAGLLTLLVICVKPWVRVLFGLVLLAGFQWLLRDPSIHGIVFGSTQNSIIGSLSWGGLLILATAAADGFFEARAPERRMLALLLSGVAALAAGLVLSQWFPVSKNRASSSYMLVSLGLCLLIFLLFHALLDGKKLKLKWLCAMGKNPLAMYVAQLFILGIFTLPGAACWYAEAPAWLAAVQGVVLIGLMLCLAKWMERRNIIIKL